MICISCVCVHTDTHTHHCFLFSCGQVMVSLLRCSFIHCDGHYMQYLRVSETTGILGLLALSSSVVQCAHSTCGYVCSRPVVTGEEKSLRHGFHRYKDSLGLKILTDFKIGFLFKIKIRTRNRNASSNMIL